MNCKDISELFLGYLDDEVSAEEREAVQSHLSACPSCREELETLARTQRELRQAFKSIAARVSPSPHAWEAIKQQLTNEKRHRIPILNWAKSTMKQGVEKLRSPRPVWQTALAGTLSVALILALCLTIPPMLRQPTEEMQAADIARNDSQVKSLLGEEGTLKETVPIKGAEGPTFYRVTFEISAEKLEEQMNGAMPQLFSYEQVVLDAVVSTSDERVVGLMAGYIPELSEEQKEKAIEIAKADSRIGEEAIALEVTASPTFLALSGASLSLTDAIDTMIATGTATMIANVTLERNGDIWFVEVDLAEETIINMEEKR